MRDLISKLSFVSAVPPAAYLADNVPAAIDLLGYDSAVVEIHVGVGGITFTGANKVEFVLTHSDDNITYVPVGQTDVQTATVVTGGVIRSLIAAHATPSIVKVGYVGNKRWLKLLADFTGTHGTATPLAASVVKGGARLRPAA